MRARRADLAIVAALVLACTGTSAPERATYLRDEGTPPPAPSPSPAAATAQTTQLVGRPRSPAPSPSPAAATAQKTQLVGGPTRTSASGTAATPEPTRTALAAVSPAPRATASPATAAPATPAGRRADYAFGADANFFLGYPTMLDAGTWRVGASPAHPYDAFAERGVNWIRVRVWSSTAGVGGRDYAAGIAQAAARRGMNVYLALMLEPDWDQPNPEWTGAPPGARTLLVGKYCQETVAYFRGIGLTSGVYELGNELDRGLAGAGEFEVDTAKREDAAYLSARIWPAVAQLLRACQEGARQADPRARFVLHIYHGWFDAEFGRTFYRTMTANGAAFDYLGLSYYPSATGTTLDRFLANASALSTEFDRPVVVAEYAYPSAAVIPNGPFTTWDRALPGYPLTPDGQQRWLADFLRLTNATPWIFGTFYESPEWYGNDRYWGTAHWAPFSLFTSDGQAKPALDALRLR